MDFEFNARTLLVAFVFYIIVMAMTWKYTIGDGWSLPMKIVLTVTSLPLFYLVVHWQVGRG